MANPPPEFSGLNYVVIKVHNIRPVVNFYAGKLGFKITRVVEPGMMSGATQFFGGCFIRCKNLHHDVLLMFTPEDSPNQQAPSALVPGRRMHHFSLHVGPKVELDAWRIIVEPRTSKCSGRQLSAARSTSTGTAFSASIGFF